MINRTGNATLMLKGQNQLHLLTLALQPFSPSACVFLLVFSFKYIYIYSNLLHLLILQFSDCRIKSSLYLLRTRLADNNKLIIGNITGKKNPEPHLVVTSLMPCCCVWGIYSFVPVKRNLNTLAVQEVVNIFHLGTDWNGDEW